MQVGMHMDMKAGIGSKIDPNREKEAREWMEAVTGEKIGASFADHLRNGVYLCKLMNELKPGAIGEVNTTSTLPFKQLENIGNFLSACREYGVQDQDLFRQMELYDAGGREGNIDKVINAIHALGRAAEVNRYAGPKLVASL